MAQRRSREKWGFLTLETSFILIGAPRITMWVDPSLLDENGKMK